MNQIRLRTINAWLRRCGLVLVVHLPNEGEEGYPDAVWFRVMLERNNPCIPVAERRWFSW